MADKSNNQEDPTAEIERQVDLIMDPKLPNLPDAKDEKLAGPPEVPEIDIFEAKDPVETLATDEKTIPENETLTVEEAAVAKAEAENAPATDKKEKQAENSSVDDESADPLVDEIVAAESDALLEAQDAAITEAFVGRPVSFRDRLKNFVARWWQNKVARYVALGVLAAVAIAAGTIPNSRYFVLNTAGVRAAASVVVLDNTTNLPLKNVSVTLGGKTVKTNPDGVARLTSLKLGEQQLVLSQLGFAKTARTVTLGLGSNPLGEMGLKAVGTQFTFRLTDYVSGKPVANAEATSGDSTAQANDKGEIVLTLGNVDSPQFEVELTASGYRTEKRTLPVTATAATDVMMVVKRKEIFVSKQSGKYDVYKMDIDGKNKQLLLAGTGNERSQISLVPHPTDETVALVSSRGNARNQDGYLLDTLTIINVDTGDTLTLEQSERIQIVDWVQDKLVYVKVKAGTSAGNSERNQLMSYDYATSTRLQLAASNNFADIVSARGSLYYLSTNYYAGGQSQFVKVNPDNSGKQTLLSAEVWNILRTGYDELRLKGPGQDWYTYRLGDSSAKKMAQAPPTVNETRFYLDAPEGGKRSLWTEQRDGKGVLLAYDAGNKKDTAITTQSGLTYPLRWLTGRVVIYRVATANETASYVVSLDGGEPKKVTDMTNTTGLGRWYSGY